MDPDARVVVPFRRPDRELPDGLFTIKDVADASHLPQPVIAQLVPRTNTAAGFMYTAEQLQYAIDIAVEIRARASGADLR